MKLNYSVDLNSINNSPSVKDADRAIDIQSKLGNILANRQPMNPGQQTAMPNQASGFGRTN